MSADPGRERLFSDGEQLLAGLRASLNEVAAGVPFTVAATELRHLVEDAPAEERPVVEAIVSALTDALIEEREERVVLAGQANLARPGGDFATSIGPILEALEEHVVLLRLLGQLDDDPDAVSVRIGSENPVTGLQKTSLVSIGYGSGLERVASLGVLGPTRMDYPTTMASVRAVARYVSEILDENHTG